MRCTAVCQQDEKITPAFIDAEACVLIVFQGKCKISDHRRPTGVSAELRNTTLNGIW